MKHLKLLLISLITIMWFAFLSFSNKTQDSKLGFFALNVANVDSSVVWYSKIFGLKENKNMNDEKAGYKVVILKNENFEVELVELTKNKGLKVKGSGEIMGLFKVGFYLRNVDPLLNSLKDNGAAVFGRVYSDAQTNKRNFLVKDIDGNLLQFFEID
jgi:predicted lactoylglutathione lyase